MNKVSLLCGILILLLTSGPVNASLVTIGTATYGGSDYNLIWDDDNNGNSVIWLDYTKIDDNWSNQKNWVSGLEASLTYNIYSAYSVTWDDAAWRLPNTVDGLYVQGYDGTTTGGWNITSSEIGHLFYEELRNLGSYDENGDDATTAYGLINKGDFVHLDKDGWYWYATQPQGMANNAWAFGFPNGKTYTPNIGNGNQGMAVRSGRIVSVSTVPEPGTVLLFGIGLLSLAGVTRKKI